MAYKPKNKQKEEVKDEIIEVLNNKSKIKNKINEINNQKIPDPKKHQTISFIKSGIRILGYFLFLYNIEVALGVLVLSEGIGIYEELV
jgi:hypothetical protein